MPLNKYKPFPKRPRLQNFGYKGAYAYFVTILTYSRNRYFKEAYVIEPIIDLIRDAAEKERFAIDAFCFMPDHLHILLRGLYEKADMRNFIRIFKQKSGYWFKKKYNNNLWHLSYYDHVLRKDEAIKDVAMYIWNNPVRKGVVFDYKDYLFNGSFTMDMTSL